MNDSVRIFIRKGYGFWETSFCLFAKRPDGSMAIARDIEFSALDEGQAAPPGADVPIDEDGLQALLDELWGLGLRPTGYKGDSTGEVEAMRNHIGDLNSALNRGDGILDRVLTLAEKGPVIIKHPERKIE